MSNWKAKRRANRVQVENMRRQIFDEICVVSLTSDWTVEPGPVPGTMLSRSGKLQVIVSVEKHPEGVWLHVSASCPADGMLPDYDDMQLVKKLFVGDEREAVEVYAKRSEHVNLAEVRHLWCRLDARWDGRCA